MNNSKRDIFGELSGYSDNSLVSKSDLYKAIDEFTKRWNGKIVDPIEIRSLIRRMPSKAMLEASPPVEVEPVAEVIHSSGHPEWDFASCKELKGKLAVGTKLYTSPPDTEANLKRAVEALKLITSANLEYRQDSKMIEISSEVLKDIGEIK